MKQCITAIIVVVFLISMIACSGGSGGGKEVPETDIYGTVATGAPVEGGIYIKDSTGKVKSTAIDDNGSFSIDVSDLKAPFILYAEGISGTDVVRLYSVAYKAGRANVTSATSLVVAIALNAVPADEWSLDKIRDESTVLIPPAEDSINNAKNNIDEIIGNGYSTGFDIMSGSFNADGTGFDALLDILDMKVTGAGKAGVSVSITDAITGEEYTSSNTVEASDVSSLGDIKSVRTLMFEYAGAEDNSSLVDDVKAVCATDIMENGKTGIENAFSELMVFDHKLDSSWTWGVSTTVIGPVEAVTLGDIGLGSNITINSISYSVDTTTTINDPQGREAVCCLESFWVQTGEDRPGQDYVFYYIMDDGEWKYWGNRALVTTEVYGSNEYSATQIKSSLNFNLTGNDYANDPDYIFITGDGIDTYVIYKKPSSPQTGEYQYDFVSGSVNTLEVNSLVYYFTAVSIEGTTLVPAAQWAMVCDGRPAGRILVEDDFPVITVPGSITTTEDLVISWIMPATADCEYNPRVKIKINEDGGWRVTSNSDGTGSAAYSYTDLDPELTAWSPCEGYETGDALEAQVCVFDLQGVKYSKIKYALLTSKK